MVPAKKNHVLVALLLIAITGAGVGGGAEGATTPIIVGDVKALLFCIVPCSAGRSINVATAPPFANASLQLQCGIPALSRSKPVNIAAIEGRRRRRASQWPVVSASGVSVSATVQADTNGDFITTLGVNGNSSGGGMVVTTPLSACSVSLSGITGTLSAPLCFLSDLPKGIGTPFGYLFGAFNFSTL